MADSLERALIRCKTAPAPGLHLPVLLLLIGTCFLLSYCLDLCSRLGSFKKQGSAWLLGWSLGQSHHSREDPWASAYTKNQPQVDGFAVLVWLILWQLVQLLNIVLPECPSIHGQFSVPLIAEAKVYCADCTVRFATGGHGGSAELLHCRRASKTSCASSQSRRNSGTKKTPQKEDHRSSSGRASLSFGTGSSFTDFPAGELASRKPSNWDWRSSSTMGLKGRRCLSTNSLL